MSESLSTGAREALEVISDTIKLVIGEKRSLEQLRLFNNGQNPFAPEFIKPEAVAKRSYKKQMRLAENIFGKDFLGPQAVFKAFDVELSPEQIPPIPFSRQELIQAKKFNQFLDLRIDKMANGQPATMENLCNYCQTKFDELKAGKVLCKVSRYKDEEFYTTDMPRLGWHLVSREPIEGSLGKNYLSQTQALVAYLKEVFGDNMPDKYQESIIEFTIAKEKIKSLMDDNWQEAAEQLKNLSINQLCRRLPVEERYDFLIYFLNNKERLLENRCDWTRRLNVNGELVNLGNAGVLGANVDSNKPVYYDDILGACFSRGL